MSAKRATRRLSVRTWLALIVAVITAVWVAVAALSDTGSITTPPGSALPGSAQPVPNQPGASGGEPGTAGAAEGVTVVATRERAPQPYRRAAFGRAWTDDQSAPLGRNGCDTRNDILDRDLSNKTYTRVSSCPRAVATGTLIDPYSGSRIEFIRGPKTSATVQIDHIIALAYAWDMGAWSWDDAKRTRFANDPRNLVAVDGPANENKRDSPPGRWMPSNERFHCQYSRQFTLMAREYGLSIDRASAAVVAAAEATCR